MSKGDIVRKDIVWGILAGGYCPGIKSGDIVRGILSGDIVRG